MKNLDSNVLSPLPVILEGWGAVRRFDPSNCRPMRAGRLVKPLQGEHAKVAASFTNALHEAGFRSGQTISFHHHLRNGDAVVNAVLQWAADHGIGDLVIAASSLFPVHAPLVEHMRNGTVRGIRTGYVKGPVADAIRDGLLATPLIFQSHGGRARALSTGELNVDIAFVAAPFADVRGAATGALGKAACGPLGYAMVDARYARRVVVLAAELSHKHLSRAEISPDLVDVVVHFPDIGDPSGIQSGSTQATSDPVQLGIADLTARAIAASGAMVEGFSFQTGAGGTSLAVASSVARAMTDAKVTGGFISGGVTAAQVDMVRAGLFREIIDVQSFDLQAVASFREDPWHRAMSAEEYASPLHPHPICEQLSVMILGAAEVDREFNVNVTVGGDGRILGGPGGHPDTAAGAKLTIVTTQSTSRGHPKFVHRVSCLTTPGQDVDLVVTERGIAVNPLRPDLKEQFQHASLPLVDIESLISDLSNEVPVASAGRVVAAVEYRDGSILDVIRSQACH